MNLNALPAELKAYPQFIVWKYGDVRKDGKRAKIPCNPANGKNASVTDSETWGTYDEACSAMPSHEGIGFVLTERDPFTFIDLDDTKGNARDYAQQEAIVRHFDSYTEISPSGKGKHIIVRGKIGKGKRRGSIEIYSDSRYMTVTGDVHLSRPIADKQDDLTNLWKELGGSVDPQSFGTESDSPQIEIDGGIIDRLLKKPMVVSLVHGDLAQHNNDHSAADFALINHLCFASPNNEQVRRLFRATPLGQRPKALRDDYLNGMIQKIRGEKLPEVDLSKLIERGNLKPVNTKTISGDELLARTFLPIQWAIHGLVPAGVSLLVGAPKLGKSWLCLQAAISVAGALPLWEGRAAEIVGDVLALCLEDNPRRLHGRLRSLLPSMAPGGLSVQRLHFATEWPRANEGGIAMLEEWLLSHPATRLVMIDTLARFRAQDDARTPPYERDTKTIAEIQTLANRHGCAFVVVHHTRKDNNGDALDAISGTNGLSGAADASLILTRVRGQAESSLFITGRDVEEQSLALRFDHSLCVWSQIENPSDIQLGANRRQVVEALRKLGPTDVPSLTVEIGKPENAIRILLSRMVECGIIERPARGLYALRVADLSLWTDRHKPVESVTQPCFQRDISSDI